MGFPILGDPQYNSEESRAYSDTLGLTSQLLCAYSLEFVHPITGELLTITTKMDIK
jgi:23S rRNA-/tRNA-specific pseudouridylate synthase